MEDIIADNCSLSLVVVLSLVLEGFELLSCSVKN